VTPTVFGSTVGYPSDSLASCLVLDSDHAECRIVLCCFSEIDLLKEENRQLQRTIDEKSAKVAAVEEELKNARDRGVDNEVRHWCLIE